MLSKHGPFTHNVTQDKIQTLRNMCSGMFVNGYGEKGPVIINSIIKLCEQNLHEYAEVLCIRDGDKLRSYPEFMPILEDLFPRLKADRLYFDSLSPRRS